jgi:hypothetical protein
METVLLGIVGAVLSLIFSYLPAAKAWFDGLANKGLVMLAMVLGVGAVYFGLACSPFAVDLNIVTTCDKAGVIALLKAIFVIASGNQLAYLFTPKAKA